MDSEKKNSNEKKKSIANLEVAIFTFPELNRLVVVFRGSLQTAAVGCELYPVRVPSKLCIEALFFIPQIG